MALRPNIRRVDKLQLLLVSKSIAVALLARNAPKAFLRLDSDQAGAVGRHDRSHVIRRASYRL